jgi:hypothetical protein
MACIFAALVAVYLQAVFRAYCAGILLTYLRTKFHSPSFSGLLVIAMKAKDKKKFRNFSDRLFQ